MSQEHEDRENRQEQERQLWDRYQSEPTPENRNALVLYYLGFIRYVVDHKFPRINQSAKLLPDDLINSGVLGLISAISQYEPSQGGFIRYSYSRVKGAMQDWLRALSSRQAQISESDSLAQPDEGKRRLENQDEVDRMLAGLSELERYVAYEYHGLEKRMDVIASETGLSRHKVGRVNKAATKKLRGLAGADHEMVLLGVKGAK
jgi:RNA polymerase sigma factor (sigma-70 family)